jgi:hypothetical protein
MNMKSGVEMDSPGTKPSPGNGEPDLASPAEQFLLVVFLLIIFLALVGLLFAFWPNIENKTWNSRIPLLGVDVGKEVRLFVLVVCAGALGAYVHVATSVGDYIGNRALVRRWVYWYILRLPVGATVSLLFYLLLRGGVISGVVSSAGDEAPPYGFVGLSALAGMFSKIAANKLREVFEAMFRPKDDGLKNSLEGSENSTSPVLSQLVPNKIPRAGATVKLVGSNFDQSSLVRVGGLQRKPTYVSATELLIELKGDDVATHPTIAIQVETPNVTDAKAPALSNTLPLSVAE